MALLVILGELNESRVVVQDKAKDSGSVVALLAILGELDESGAVVQVEIGHRK